MLITGINQIISNSIIHFNTQYGDSVFINFDNIMFFTMQRVMPANKVCLVIGAFGNKGIKITYNVFEEMQKQVNLNTLLKLPEGTLESEFLRVEVN